MARLGAEMSGPIVTDTMVLAYALLGVPEHRESAIAVLDRADGLHAPDSIRAELVNVVWQWVTHRGTPLELGLTILQDAEALIEHVHHVDGLWERGLELAVEARHPAYDTLFVALAERENLPLVTYDRKLAATFPQHCILATHYLADGR